jgi:hypothetical protein
MNQTRLAHLRAARGLFLVSWLPAQSPSFSEAPQWFSLGIVSGYEFIYYAVA